MSADFVISVSNTLTSSQKSNHDSPIINILFSYYKPIIIKLWACDCKILYTALFLDTTSKGE